MITTDKIFTALKDVEDHIDESEREDFQFHRTIFLVGKALVYAVIYAAELIAKSIRNSS
jgi:hypothetical protein